MPIPLEDPVEAPGESETLMDVLLDRSARWDERDDAAMDLGDSDEPDALEALFEVGSDASEDDVLLQSVGDSIAEILLRHPEWVGERIGVLAPTALRAYKARHSAG